MVGTIIEWYDIFIFGTGAIYISAELFPPTNKTVALLNTFLVFALGFVTRPVGALFFGHFGDKLGRKKMLLFTLLASGISSGFVGLLPSYAVAGIFTIVALVILRLVLGFGLGGEWGGAVLLMVENTEKNKAFWASFVQSTVGIGLILGSIVFLILSSFTSNSFMYSIGWRIPFLLSFLMAIIGLVVRVKIVEDTAEFKKILEQGEISRFPMKDLFKSYWKEVILGTIFAGSLGTIFYVGAILVPAIMEEASIITPSQGFLATMLMGLFDSIFSFVGGKLSAITGEKTLLFLSNILGLILLYPSIYVKSSLIVIILILSYGIAHGIGYSPLASLISNMFETRVRYSGSSAGYQFGNSFIGGPASYVSYYLGSIDYALYPAFAIIVIVVTFIGLFTVKEKVSNK
ncbi:MFS transporter [Acidianus sulfidivorans JP7]|uniref:MFS transporter n=2 Tax=Acidianus TaxID=12914 RepID=A0A2U9IQ99_9CREN|nr:MFS transporter [Acidianus sulfidivorans JP7]